MNEPKRDGFFDRVYAAVRRIPKGRVASYGLIAMLAGNPRAPRVVGYALHRNPDPENTPCYRVVTCGGKTSKAFAFGGEDMQRLLLEKDGVRFSPDGTVPRRYFWDGKDERTPN